MKNLCKFEEYQNLANNGKKYTKQVILGFDEFTMKNQSKKDKELFS